MSNLNTPEGRFLSNLEKLLQYLEEVVVNLPPNTTGTINKATLNVALAYAKREPPNKLVNTFIERSQMAWIYAYHETEEQLESNIEEFRHRLSSFMGDLPAEISEEIITDIKKLMIAKKDNGQYLIGRESAQRVYVSCQALLRTALSYVEANAGALESPRTITIPFKGKMLTYKTQTPVSHELYQSFDVGLWRTLFPRPQAPPA